MAARSLSMAHTDWNPAPKAFVDKAEGHAASTREKIDNPVGHSLRSRTGGQNALLANLPQEH